MEIGAVKRAGQASSKFEAGSKEVQSPGPMNRKESNFKLDYQWLRRYGAEHPGKWVVLQDGVLLEIGESLEQVRTRAYEEHEPPFLITQL